MSRTAIFIAVIVVILIVIVLSIGGANARRYEKYLAGMWIGDPGFLKKAQLKDLQLFIAPREDGCRQGYLIITDMSGNFITNQAVEIRCSSLWGSALKTGFKTEKDSCKVRSFEIEYDNLARGEEPPMPTQMKMALSILDGSLTLYDDKKVYAFLEKDLAASSAALEAYEK
jgi:hypothetical protein